MLLQLVSHHPEAIRPILANTPLWVWGLFAALLALGASQLRDREASVARVSLMPAAMTGFSVWGTYAALGGSRLLGQAVVVWLAAAVLAFMALAPGRAQARFDAVRRVYALPGSVLPMLLIVAIFSVKYVVGVELAMAPALVQDTQYALTVAALYGAFTGVFAGRAMRLWRLALAPAATTA